MGRRVGFRQNRTDSKRVSFPAEVRVNLTTIRPIRGAVGAAIDRSTLERLEIDREAVLEVATEGRKVFLNPLRTVHHERVMASARTPTKSHHPTLERLAE